MAKGKRELSKLEQDLLIPVASWDAFWEAAGKLGDDILCLRYDNKGNVKRTQKEVGEVMGISRERVRQRLAKSIRRMRHPSRAKLYARRPRPDRDHHRSTNYG